LYSLSSRLDNYAAHLDSLDHGGPGNLAHFLTPGVPFAEICDIGFPGLDTCAIPSGITDFKAFSPMLEMGNISVWDLTCNAVFTMGSQEAQTALQEYLKHGKTAITGSLYHGASIPGQCCPNFTYHFKVASNWPTSPSHIAELTKLHIVSEQAPRL
jgi:hypothetical protein